MGIPINVPGAGRGRGATTTGGGLNEVSSGANLGAAGGWTGFNKPTTFQGNTGGIDPNVRGGGGTGALQVDPASLLSKGGGGVYNTPGSTPFGSGGVLGGKGGEVPPPGTGGTSGSFIPGRAPTAAEVAANPNAFKGTSFDPARNLMQGMNTGLATNMGMKGAQNVGGTGMYTGSNGPLDLSRFTPQGGAGTEWYNYLFGKNNPNNISYLGFVDQLGRNALGGRQQWSERGALQDQLDYMNSEVGQQWLSGLMGINQEQPTVDEPATGGPDPGNTQTPVQQTTPQVDPAQNAFQNPQQIVQAMMANGMNPNDIPIQLRLMAQGIQPRQFTSQGYTPVANPFLQMMQNGMGNPFMQMMMAMGGGGQ